LHTKNRFGQPTDRKLFGGSSIGIAYSSDPRSIKPNDMTIISVNQDSPFVRETRYPVPAGMPPCPAAGCICSWNWIHRSNNGEGYGAEIVSAISVAAAGVADQCSIICSTAARLQVPPTALAGCNVVRCQRIALVTPRRASRVQRPGCMLSSASKSIA
jgi:hypothetical protein